MKRSASRFLCPVAWCLVFGALGQAQDKQPTSEAGAAEERWPLEVQAGDDQITIYQPQLESFKGDKLTARAAVSIQGKGRAEPVFGALWLESRVATDRTARTVDILDVKVTRARFPDDADREPELTAALRSQLAGHSMALSLDELLAALALVEKEKSVDEQLLNEPPKIEFRAHPAVLIAYDGQPRFSSAGEGKLMRAVNTPFLVVLDPDAKTYYLKGAGQWFQATEALGPFQDAPRVPDAVRALAEKGGYQDPDGAAAGGQEQGVEIVTATEPTELIWTDGPPQFGAVAGTSLLYVTNTDADVFMNIDSQDLYVLLSGRWFRAPGRNGPWTYVAPDKLPPDFQRIPPGSAKGDVLAHVAGTEAAQDALLDTYVPQTAVVDRKKVQPPTVEYDGEPKFEAVEGVQVTYAVNTASAVLGVDGAYYCCDNAVWYVGPAPVGPWELCVAVPPVIYTLPPSCPVYPVKYVYVYDHDPDFVYCGYTPGYVGCYVHAGAVVFGTGYLYHPWIGAAYYPRPYTFGFCAHYNAYTGNWGFTAGVRGPNGWLAVHGGTYGWWAAGGRTVWAGGGGWWGYGGYRHADFNRNINVNNVNFNRNINIDQNRLYQSNTNVYNRRNDVRNDMARPPIGAGGPGRPGTLPPRGDRPPANRPANDVFADSQGNVHRKTLDGWESRNKGQWTPPQRGASPAPGAAPQRRPELDQAARARAAGAQRSDVYQRPAGARPSGGPGMRGGGGGRRR